MIKIFREDRKTIQVRFSISRLGKSIRNIALIFNRGFFISPIILTYEKHSTNGNKKVVKYYVNNKLWSYAESEFIENFEVIKVYSSDGHLFSMETTEFNENNEPISIKGWVENADGTFTEINDSYSEENP